jgi:RsiW-degrading membrane proteinase PrsW (M82 family)
MLDYMINFFISGFYYPGISWNQLLIAIGLALVFGAVWFAAYWVPVLKKPWAWAVLAAGGILSWIAVAFVQVPLQILSGQLMGQIFDPANIKGTTLLIAGIPQILLSGLVQEGSKMVPMVVFWLYNEREMTPKLGLVVGALAGLGLGVFESVYAHNTMFMAGWTPALVQSAGIMAFAGFWERFFTLALHISMSALVGYGLAKGWGWQFYLLAALIHSAANYSVALVQAGIFNTMTLEIYVAMVAVVTTAVVLWLRYRPADEMLEFD